MDICETIKFQTAVISRQVAEARQTGLGIQEESITDFILNRIQLEHEGNFYTKKFTRREEGNLSGADWLWCIGEPGSWITFAVQAKITNIQTGRINYLHYRNGKQFELLINFCKHFGFIPKYTVYADVGEEMHFFSRGIPVLRDIAHDQWSFSAISPKYVKHLTSRVQRQISSVLAHSIPWSYVLCQKDNRAGTLAESIASKLEEVYWTFENEYRRQNGQKPRSEYKRTIWENPQPNRMVTDSMPLSVLYLLTQAKLPFKIPIPNVSVFSTKPALQALDIELQRVESTRQWKNFPRVFERQVAKLQESTSDYLLLESGW